MAAGQQSNLRIGAIIQARMKSERLPGKIIRALPFPNGKPLLWWIVNSLRKSKFVTDVVLATSRNEENNVLETFSSENKVFIFRGSEEDVLSRFIQVIKEKQFDIVVRVTADNPFLDYETLDKTIEQHLATGRDYSITVGLPAGMNFEVVSAKALLSLETKNLSDADREHVTWHIRTHDEFKKGEIRYFDGEGLNALRLTVDYPSDFALASLIFNMLEPNHFPTIGFIRKLREEQEWIFRINESNVQKPVA